MKLTGGSFFGLLSLALGAGLIFEIAQSRDQAARLNDLKRGLAVQRSAARELASQVDGLQEQRDALSARALRAEKALADAKSSNAAPAPPPPGAAPAVASAESGAMASWLGQMLKDPGMLRALRLQQAAALRIMYGDLVKQWGLSPADADTFYHLLLEKQMATMTSGQAYLDGKASALDVASSGQDLDARLRAALGDNLFSQYQDYEKTVADRAVLNQFQQQLASASNASALTVDQTNFLLRAMTEERQAQAANTSVAAAALTRGGTLDQGAIDALTQAQSEINQRVDQRAGSMLTADQFAAFKSFQNQMLETQKAGMQMSASMAGGAPTGP